MPPRRPPTPPPARCAGPHRSEPARLALLDAALEEVTALGYRDASIEGIARRACASKQTIYRWWPSKAALVMEAYARVAALAAPLPDEGDVEADLVAFFVAHGRLLTRGPGHHVLPAIIAEMQSDPAIAEAFRATLVEVRRAQVRALLARGVARGTLRPDLDPEIFVDLLIGSVWYRMLLGRPLDDGFYRDMVRAALLGMRAADAGAGATATAGARVSRTSSRRRSRPTTS